MITLEDYAMGRPIPSPLDQFALLTVERANRLLSEFGEDRRVTSGYRTPAINAATPGAAKRSKHMTCQAIDLEDHDGDLDEWCIDNPGVLERLGLWQEHPAATKGWCHLQTVPPMSGRRVFYP